MAGFSYSYKHAFDFWYKWAPLGVDAVGTEWPNGSISASAITHVGPNGTALTYGFYNMGQFLVPALTRNPAVISPDMLTSTIAVTGTSPDESALPWGSSAIDFLWNVQNLSCSISQYSENGKVIGTSNYVTEASFSYGTASFNYHNWGWNPQTGGAYRNGYGLTEYPVTSSWTVYESKLNAGENGRFRVQRTLSNFASAAYFPATLVGSGSGGYEKPSARILDTPSYAEKPYFPSVPSTSEANALPAGFNPTNLTYTGPSTGSFDGRFYDLTGGCGITREAISASLVAFADETGTSLADRQIRSTALKNRRLFFPTILTGSSSPYTSPPTQNPNPIGTEWLGLVNGSQGSDIYFEENGGIYNVKFNLKRDLANDYYPDSGGGAELLAYIHDINAVVPNNPTLGDTGWLPPENNIVRIKNNPVMSFLNPATGYQIETFNINLIQYGAPAQLVFEATGSLAAENYFGCIIDDVTFCKVGVSTDPLLIKPTTAGGAIAYEIDNEATL